MHPTRVGYMNDPKVNPDVTSALSSTKSVLAIVNGLTLTNAVLVLITGARYSRVIPLDKLGTENIVFAVVLMANVIRFYHGNVRHLDAAYGSESVVRAASGRHVEPRGGFGLDFTIIFIQSLLFSVTSFYILSHSSYLSLFIVLLGFDIIWAVYSEPAQGDQAASPQRMWLLNNMGAITGLVVFFIIYKSHPGRNWAINAAVGVLAATTIIDFVLNWGFYFPRRFKEWRPGDRINVFLSAPLTQYVDADDPAVMDRFRSEWDRVAEALERSGHEVFSAHKREAWGANLATPESALKADIAGLAASDFVIAYIGDPPSPGVQMELGYAIANHKRMLVFIKYEQREPYLVHGLSTLPNSKVIEISDLGAIRLTLARMGLIEWTSLDLHTVERIEPPAAGAA
jgi:hypothetical protein